METSRVRIIAGPNGSGKTTLYFFLKERINTGIWLNADEILESFKRKGFIEYAALGFTPDLKSFRSFCKRKSSQIFIETFRIGDELLKLQFGEFAVSASNKFFSNESAAFLTDYFRHFLAQKKQTFTSETVLSHPSKLDFVKRAKKATYRTYLYFIATNSPRINIKRVRSRVYKGGHHVSSEKLSARYTRSIKLLKESIKIFDRVYIFDNSGKGIQLIASYSDGQFEKMYSDKKPDWLNFSLK